MTSVEVGEAGRKRIDVSPDVRGQIGVGGGRKTPGDQFDHRGDSRRQRNLRESDATGELLYLSFVDRIAAGGVGFGVGRLGRTIRRGL